MSLDRRNGGIKEHTTLVRLTKEFPCFLVETSTEVFGLVLSSATVEKNARVHVYASKAVEVLTREPGSHHFVGRNGRSQKRSVGRREAVLSPVEQFEQVNIGQTNLDCFTYSSSDVHIGIVSAEPSAVSRVPLKVSIMRLVAMSIRTKEL